MSSTDTVKGEADHLASATRNEAGAVAEEAKAQVRNVMDDARGMVDEQSRTQRDRLVDTARTFGNDLETMAGNGPDGIAGDLARQLAHKARDLSEQLDGREPSEILDQVRDFARRRPGMFLLGAAAAGVLVGRIARGAKDANSSTGSGPSSARPPASTTAFEAVPPPVVPDGDTSYAGSQPVTSTGLPNAQPGTRQTGFSDTPMGDEAQRRML